MLLGRIGGLEAKFAGDLGTGGWCASAGDGGFNQVQDLLLAGGEFGVLGEGLVDHGGAPGWIGSLFRPVGRFGDCLNDQYLYFYPVFRG